VRMITSPSDRGLLLAQLAKLAARSGDADLGQAFFREALENSDLLAGRKEQLNRGLVALEYARVFQFSEANDIAEQLTDIVVKDPIGNEIMATERTFEQFLPPEVRAANPAKEI